MTRILNAALLAAALLLPTSALADQEEQAALICADAQRLAKGGEDGPILEEALDLCAAIQDQKEHIDAISQALFHAEETVNEMVQLEFHLRVDMVDAKAAYAAERTADNFYAIVDIQKAWNQLRAELPGAIEEVSLLAQALTEAEAEVAFMAEELEHLVP